MKLPLALALETSETETPLATMQGYKLAGGIGITPILRAGLGLAEGFREVISDAQVWHLGLRRDEHTLQALEYYNQLPIKSISRSAMRSILCWQLEDLRLMPSIFSSGAAFLVSPM